MTATIHDVAREAGVSIATVSRVLAQNYPVAKATRERVLAAVSELNYSANPNARRLRGAGANPIAVLLSSITGPSFAALAQGVEREARSRGRVCVIGVTGGDADRELELVELMRRQKTDAIILPGGWRDAQHRERMTRLAETLAAEGVRLVLAGNRPLSSGGPGLAAVRYDNEAGAERVARVVADAGHQRVLLLPGLVRGSTAAERLAGFRAAFAATSPSDLRVVQTTFDREPARDAILGLLDEAPGRRPPFTAVVCATDQVAMGVLEALRSRGLRCPEDVSVTGYDDVPAAYDLGLTTVRVPYEEMGARAVSLALDEGAGDVLFATELIVRSSVGTVANRAEGST